MNSGFNGNGLTIRFRKLEDIPQSVTAHQSNCVMEKYQGDNQMYVTRKVLEVHAEGHNHKTGKKDNSEVLNKRGYFLGEGVFEVPQGHPQDKRYPENQDDNSKYFKEVEVNFSKDGVCGAV